VRKYLKSHNLKIVMTLVSSVMLISLSTGCASAPTRGWSGITVSGNNLYIGSFNGTVVGMDATTRSKLFNDLTLNKEISGGILGCGAGAVPVNIYATPIAAPDLDAVFVAGYDGRVYSVSMSKGVKNWVYPKEGVLTPIIGGLVLNNNRLYFGGTNGNVYAIDAKTGDWIWSEPFQTGNKVWATGIADSDTLYIGSYDKNLYALNLTDGTKKWQFETGGAIMSAPVLQYGVLYFGSFDRYFYAVNAENGSLIWKSTQQALNWYWANPVMYNNTIYAPNIDGKVYIFNAQDGQTVISPINLNHPVSSSPVIVGNKLIIANENGKSDSEVWAIDMGNYTAKMVIDLKKIVYAPLSVNQNVVYIHTQDNFIYALNADTEVILWSQPVNS
jgi:outer membrane protein assembly factor BamB